MALPKSAMKGVAYQLQTAATTGAGLVVAIPTSFERHKFIIKGSAGIGAGKVKVETADAYDYAGTWVLVGTEVTLIASTELAVDATSLLRVARVNVSTTVTGGTFDASYVGA